MKISREKIFIVTVAILFCLSSSTAMRKWSNILNCISKSRRTCTSNNNCHLSEICHPVEKQCVNACLEKKCKQYEACQVYNHESSCECLPGFKHNPSTGLCEEHKKCYMDSDCHYSDVCGDKGECINACSGLICNTYEGCQIVNRHLALCECMPGFKRSYSNDRCMKNNQCNDNRDCLYTQGCGKNDTHSIGTCFNLCSDKTCGKNEVCQVKDGHTFSCDCSSGYARPFSGAPCESSFKKCTENKECDISEQCIEDKCVDVCFDKNCEGGEGCQITSNHTGSCQCLPGYKYSVSYGGCIPNDRCGDDRDCLYAEGCDEDGRCFSLCPNEICGKNEVCKVLDGHGFSCDCSFGHERPSPEAPCEPISKKCTKNEECDISEECKEDECINACFNKKCSIGEGCQISNHTSSCECLPGHKHSTKDGACILNNLCKVPDDCSYEQTCDGDDKCVDVCTDKICPDGQKCQLSAAHTYSCK